VSVEKTLEQRAKTTRLTPTPDLQSMAATDSQPVFLSSGHLLSPSRVFVGKVIMTAMQCLLLGACCSFVHYNCAADMLSH